MLLCLIVVINERDDAMKELTNQKIEDIYNRIIVKYHQQYLDSEGVKIPKLKNSQGEYTKNALVLVYLADNYPNQEIVTKEELTNFIRKFYPSTNDVQQARHLGAQSGWYIVSRTRNDDLAHDLPPKSYKLVTLERPYPGFNQQRRSINMDWEQIKREYDYRCATCGSKEGEPHHHWENVVVKLQKAHMDPTKELTPDNTIPQCQICNRADRNRWKYDSKGRVIGIANEQVIQNCDEDIKRKIYKILYDYFEGKDPTTWS